MENQICIDLDDEKHAVEPKKQEKKPVEVSIKPSAIQMLKTRWARFVVSLPEMPRWLDRPGYYQDETTTPDQVRLKVYVPDRFGFRY